jgi:uncharacterized protein (DUF433 family)
MRETEMAEALSLTLNEAGYVVEQSCTAINRAVDKGIIKARLQRRGKSRLRQVGAPELRYLAIAGLVEKDLTPAARKKIYDAVRRLPATEHRLDLGVMELKLAEIDQRIAERLRQLAAIKAHVDESAPEPRLKEVGVPVHVIAGLARGESVEEIMEDYPSLRREQVVAAIEYAKVYPRTGRPLPQRSFKRMLGELAVAGVWDLESDEEPLEPHTMP